MRKIELVGTVVYEPFSMAVFIRTPEGLSKDVSDILCQFKGKTIKVEITVEE